MCDALNTVVRRFRISERVLQYEYAVPLTLDEVWIAARFILRILLVTINSDVLFNSG